MPYQYYSGSCQKTYQKLNRGFIRTGEDEQQALCTDDFSDISPLTGGNVAFSTLEGRPSAYNFDNSPVLQVSKGKGPEGQWEEPRSAPLPWLCSVGVRVRERKRESESGRERFLPAFLSLPALFLPSVATGCSATPPTFPLLGAAAGSPSPLLSPPFLPRLLHNN